MKKSIMLIAFFSVLFIIFKYNDAELFQKIMKFLLNPDQRFVAPKFWQDFRMYILGGFLVLLIISYKSVWLSTKDLIRVYRNSPLVNQKPELSARQASFLYLRDQTRYFMVWIIELSQSGILSLHFKRDNYYQWSVEKKYSAKGIDPFYGQLISTLFKNGNILQISPFLSKSNFLIEEVALKLFNKGKSETLHLCQLRKRGILFWVFSLILLLEIPSFNALHTNNPGMIIYALFSAFFFSFPFYVFAKQLPALFSGYLRPRIILVIAIISAIIPQIFIFGMPNKYYFATAFYLDIAIGTAIFIFNLPFFLKDNSILEKIVGYKKYLSMEEAPFGESELPWTLGLDVHTDILSDSFLYKGRGIPRWIESSEKDVQVIIKGLHQTLYQSINRAIFGETDSKDKLSRNFHR